MKLEDLVNQNTLLFTKVDLLETGLSDLTKKIQSINYELDELKNERKEIYYQRFLEKHFQASHKVTKYGITDITTETHHIEIKQWKSYKSALGQLRAYNYGDNKQLIVALFGEFKDKAKVIELFHSNEIVVWDLIKTPYSVDIVKYEKNTNANDFDSWLLENINYETDSNLKLSDVCKTYSTRNIARRNMVEYKVCIENFIKKQHPSLKHTYTADSRHHGKKYAGWLHLKLKN